MKLTFPSNLAPVAVAAMLCVPVTAMAQSPSTAPTAPTTVAPTATAPMTTAPAARMAAPPTGNSQMSQRVEQRINELHTQLRITAAEQPQWDQFAAVMRDNARDMDGLLEQRGQQFASMNALQDMQSYEQLAEKHAEHLQKLTAAFETLYNQLPANQKQMADQVFRAQAQQREQHAMQSGHSR